MIFFIRFLCLLLCLFTLDTKRYSFNQNLFVFSFFSFADAVVDVIEMTVAPPAHTD